jgi:hypothetical protein
MQAQGSLPLTLFCHQCREDGRPSPKTLTFSPVKKRCLRCRPSADSRGGQSGKRLPKTLRASRWPRLSSISCAAVEDIPIRTAGQLISEELGIKLANVMVWTAPAPASRSIESCAKMVLVEQPSEGAPSMGKSITDLSSVTTVGLDLAKHVFQVHALTLLGA